MATLVNVSSPSTNTACAAFQVAHGLGSAPPDMPEIENTKLGEIAFVSPYYDATHFYFTASGPNLTAIVKVELCACRSW